MSILMILLFVNTCAAVNVLVNILRAQSDKPAGKGNSSEKQVQLTIYSAYFFLLIYPSIQVGSLSMKNTFSMYLRFCVVALLKVPSKLMMSKRINTIFPTLRFIKFYSSSHRVLPFFFFVSAYGTKRVSCLLTAHVCCMQRQQICFHWIRLSDSKFNYTLRVVSLL